MPELARADAKRMLGFLADAEALGGDEPFTDELLAELGQLVEADWISYCELDRVRKRFLLQVERTGDESADPPDHDAVFWGVVVEEHPVCVRHQQGHHEALKISDFLSRRQLHRTRLYDLWLRPYRVEHQLNVAIPSPLWHTKTFLLDRGGSRDFTERDRQVLDLLQPHLGRLWRAARTRRLLSAAFTGLEEASNGRGVVLLGAGGTVELATAPARTLLEEFFPHGSAGRLPLALQDWLEAGSELPFELGRGSRRLSVDRSDGALLLEARTVEVALTPREREVLSWVARGKTNDEIARLLWLSPGTVRKHLENVYAKLGVRTRTAAVARFLGLIDAEAS